VVPRISCREVGRLDAMPRADGDANVAVDRGRCAATELEAWIGG